MSGNVSRALSALTTLVVLTSSSVASAQWYSQPNCQCAQPVTQTCYQTVPVTAYRQVKQTVQRPVVETKYVDREFTEYRPVVETRTAEIPTVQYQNVTEYQTVQRDAGCWTTQYQCVNKPSPCEYDGRPGLFGMLNRSAYNIRSAFTPNVIARRQYVPNIIAQTVPVTRQVAIRGTKQVSYNVTRMVAHKTTRKVAVNTVRYVAEEVTVNQPVTVMRTVPIGSRTAMMYSPFVGGTATAILPTPDPLGSRSADSSNDKNSEPKREASSDPGIPATRSSLTTPSRQNTEENIFRDDHRADVTAARPVTVAASRIPSLIRASGWKVRETPKAKGGGPILPSPSTLLVGNIP